MEEILLYFSLKYQGDFDKIFKALEQKEKVDLNLKEQLFHVANLSMGYNLFVAERLEDMSDICSQAHLDSNFYQYRDQERIAIYVNSAYSIRYFLL